MNKENIRRRIRNVTAFSAALLLAASFSLPSGTEIMGERVGNAIVASAEMYGDYEYEVNSDGGTVTITRYHGSDSNFAIPREIDGKLVTAIGDECFVALDQLTSIVIPDSVTSIGNYAFQNCCRLSSIEIPYGVTSIGERTFGECENLGRITIPDSVVSIGAEAFRNCERLYKVTLPSNISFTSIADRTFLNCANLTSITIPNGVTSIGEEAFIGCSGLGYIDISDSVTSIADRTFLNCASLTSITIPNSVTSIGKNAFEGCESLESVTLPSNSSFTSIADQTFLNCAILTSITIPNSVNSIGNEAFCRCTSLTSMTIPNSVNSIGYGAFRDCINLTSIFLPDGATVNDGAIPASATQIKYSVDENSNVKITNVTPGMGVTSVTVPDTIDGKKVTAVGDSAIRGCSSLTSINLPDGLTSIGEYAFGGCSGLTSITIPDSVESIGKNAFERCQSLASVTLPSNSSVTSIGTDAFLDCTSLTSIFIPDSLNVSSANINIPASATQIKYTVDENSNVTITKVTPGVGVTSVTVPDTIDGKKVTAVGDSAIRGCSSLTSINLPDGVTSIGINAFAGCSGLTSITIPNSVNSIKSGAFDNCTSLESITLPSNSSFTSIEDGTFYYCTSLKGITIPDCVTSIGNNAFMWCTSLTSITIPDSVTSIGNNAFSGCDNLKSIEVDANNAAFTSIDGVLFNKNKSTLIKCPKKEGSYVIPNGVTSIGEGAFNDCSSLTSITIPNGVNSIGSDTFSNCRSLTSITIPDSVTSIGESAFYNCTSLESIFLPYGLDVTKASIPDAATQIKYSVVDNSNVTITNVTPGVGVTSVTVPDTIDGKTIAVITNNAFSACSNLVRIILPQGVDTSAAGIPENATQIRYSVGEDDNITITKVSLGSGDHDLTMPQNIGDRAVTGFADGALADCPEVSHTHREKTAATCTSKAVCAICETGYGDMLEHTRESHGMCTVCHDGAEVCGINAYYVFDNNTGTLTIFGEGSVTKNNWYETTFSDFAKNIVIESGITDFDYISDFRNVESISYPDTITEIDFEKISSSKSLTSITIDKDNNNYCAVDNVVFSKDKTKLYYYLSNNPASEYVIPEGVTSIEFSAFESCKKLKNITIPSGVQNIGSGAFQCCNSLESITLPSSVTTVGWFAFYGCDKLETIFIPDGTDVSEARIPDSTTKVFYSAVDDDNVSITSITLGTEKTSVNIPVTIDGNKVIFVAKDYQQYVGEHTHVGGEATCTSKAVCVLCGNEYGETGAHSLTKHDAVSASCTKDGSIEYYECSECGKLFTDENGENEITLDKVNVTSTGHKFGTAWVSDTKEHYHECTVCHERSDIADHEKDSGTVTKEATPTESGTFTYKCKVCGVKMGEETITATISSFDVTSSNVIVYYTVTGSTEVKSQTYAFSEVTEEMVDLMKSKDIQLVIDFVNYSTAGDDTILLTEAQMKAIEYVLAHDYGM